MGCTVESCLRHVFIRSNTLYPDRSQTAPERVIPLGLASVSKTIMFYQMMTEGAFMLNLRRQNQRFETLIQNAVYGGAVYAHFFSRLLC